MNIIHYLHDKYAYEAGQMALYDTEIKKTWPLVWQVYLL